MAGFREFEARIKSDSAFRAKFAGVKSEDEMIQRAKAEGYDFEQLSDEQLDDVAGGRFNPSGAADRGLKLYVAIRNLVELIKGGNKVW